MRYERFSLVGEDASTIFTRVQGRGWDPSSPLSTAGIEDLTSSISSIGLLQPVLLEEIGDSFLLISGERRLRAMRWGAIKDPDNPHFAHVAAVVITGPIADDDRRRWQLIENVAREDLRPGELAAALLYQRCAMLSTKLLGRGVPVPASDTLDDPVQLWEALNRCRLDKGLHDCGAPWSEVVNRLGIALSAQRAEAFVRAFRALPSDVSADMDAKGVSLASREMFVRLRRSGRVEAADEIWAAITNDRPELLTRACSIALEIPNEDVDVDVDEIVERAAEIHDRVDNGDEQDSAVADAIESVLDGVEVLLGELRAGASLPGYSAGSLLLRSRDLVTALEGAHS